MIVARPRATEARRRKRLAVARWWYEGNAFSPIAADLPAFERCEWSFSNAALDGAQRTSTELACVARFAASRPDWDVRVIACASALPAGPIDDAVFDVYAGALTRGLNEGLANGGWDAVYLSLHGASITRSRATPDLDLLRIVRSIVGNAPIGASFDLHANLSSTIASLVDVASVYRTHPHVDMDETAGRVLDLLIRCVESGLRTRVAIRNDGMPLVSVNMRTDAGPMRELEEQARLATRDPLLEVGVFGGFPYADTPHTGAAALVVTDAAGDPAGDAARAAADAMAAHIRRLAPMFDVTLPSARDAVARALSSTEAGLIAITDPADNPLSGGACDTPGLARALIDARPAVCSLFASFADAGVVAQARNAGIGAMLELRLGARHGAHFGEPIALRAHVERLTEGVFRNVGAMQHGVERRFRGSALLRLLDQPLIAIIVTADVVPADDPAFYALHGIDLNALRLLCVKAKNHFRAAFADRCVAIIDCDAPGPASVTLATLPFIHAPFRNAGV
ncbi:MAG TPA: M81 family metallopeptidase [Casimicrobiaceae bacterium]|nr:M81 family metallopeptidase [Casimicrobiaceae bacterium]